MSMCVLKVPPGKPNPINVLAMMHYSFILSLDLCDVLVDLIGFSRMWCEIYLITKICLEKVSCNYTIEVLKYPDFIDSF